MGGSRVDAISGRSSRKRGYLSLFVFVVSVCLSLGVYSLLADAMRRDDAGEAHAPIHSLAAPVQPAVMKIEPDFQLVDPGDTFSVTVEIRDLVGAGLGAFEFALTYDPTYVQATDVTLGPFLGSTGRTVGEVGPLYATGVVTYGAYSMGTSPGPSGNGVLATITFQATSVGTSTLHLQNVNVTNTAGGLISTNTEDGEVEVGVASPPNVTSITPDEGYIGQVLEDVILVGTGFQENASVQLTKSGQSPISASMLEVQGSTRISCTLNLGKAVVGKWTVRVTNPDSQYDELVDGFTVRSVILPPPDVTSITPHEGYIGQVLEDVILVGTGFQENASVQLTKSGQSPISASMLEVQGSDRISCTLNLGEAVVGKWTVRVTNPDSQHDELVDGFTVKVVIYMPLVMKNY
jgi:predicted aspartyl protease